MAAVFPRHPVETLWKTATFGVFRNSRDKALRFSRIFQHANWCSPKLCRDLRTFHGLITSTGDLSIWSFLKAVLEPRRSRDELHSPEIRPSQRPPARSGSCREEGYDSDPLEP